MKSVFALSLCFGGISRVDAVTGCFDVDCNALPERETIECPIEDPKAVSPGPINVAWERRQKVTFNNTLPETVSLFWVNPNGREEFMKQLAPREATSQRTAFGHVFRMRDHLGRTLMQHKVGLTAIYNDAQVAQVRANPIRKGRRPAPTGPAGWPEHSKAGVLDAKAELTADEARKQHEFSRQAFSEGWINRAGFPVKMFWYSSDGVRGAETLAVLEPSQCTCECTYTHHEFRSFVNDGRYVAKRFADTPISMPICPEFASPVFEDNRLFVLNGQRVSFQHALEHTHANCTKEFPMLINWKMIKGEKGEF